jgi:hypothetical protein
VTKKRVVSAPQHWLVANNTFGKEANVRSEAEIEKLVADLKMFKEDWQAMIKQIEQLEHENKRLKRAYFNG